LGWTRAHAYAIADADRLNMRAADTWLAIDRARSVDEIRHAVDARLGIPWVNTIAADRNGDVLYADVTSTPDVDAAQMKRCAPSAQIPAAVATSVFVLDGSKSSCRWTVDKRAPVPGLMPAEAMPQMIRKDFVANSNDSYWLANDTAPQIGYAPIVGLINEPQNLRTRAGLIEIHDGLASGGASPITPAKAEEMIFAERNYAAEIALDDVLAVCAQHPTGVTASGKSVELAPACDALAKWDRRMNIDSRGAALFVEFWAALNPDRSPDLFAVPFDANDPVHTPRGLKRDDAAAAKITKALAQAVTVLSEESVALDAPWGSVQVAVRGDTRIPLHGGTAQDGVLDAQISSWVKGVGYVPFHGSSYMQVVTFDAQGPVADGVLSYSQSTDPASPHYADQTWLYSKKDWNRLPFAPADIKAQETSREHIAEAR
jgi:acyl-homoserine-lactone acylase